MTKSRTLVGASSVLALALSSASGNAAVYSQPATPLVQTDLVQTAQYWRGGPGWRRPGWRAGPGYYGRPYWYARPWVRRPYYGTIIAGVALGTIVTVAAVGLVPPRPAPNLCWYWADPYQNRGYWDYCS
jgi:hypothetical protein